MGLVGRRAAMVIAAVYVVAMMVVVWSPVPLTDPLNPWLVRSDLSMQARLGTPPDLSLLALEFVANVIFFVPPALLLALRLRPTSWPLVVAVGFVCTLTIEGVQLFFLPDRSATVSDVVANTLGAFIGAVAAFAARAGSGHLAEKETASASAGRSSSR